MFQKDPADCPAEFRLGLGMEELTNPGEVTACIHMSEEGTCSDAG